MKWKPRRSPARLGPRALAFVIDGLLLMAFSAPLMWLAYHRAFAHWNDTRPLSLAINWVLPGLACVGFWTWQGATPGKAAAGLRVVDQLTGDKPSLVQSLLRWFGYFVSALPLGLGFIWAALDSDRQAWHDKIARTRVVTVRALGEAGGPGYIERHWRGQQSLARSYWVNNVLLSVPLTLALSGLMSWISLKGESLQATAIAVLIGWPVALACDWWCVIGGWRAASRYLNEGGSRLWGRLAQLSLGAGMLQVLISAVFGFLPSSGEYLKMARGIDPIGQATFRLSGDGHALRLEGAIGMGDAARLEDLIATAPQLRLVELESPGGRLVEAERMVELLRGRGASTRAVGNCESACTLVFLAGSKRQLMPGAQLGFHRASSGTYNPVFDEMANQHLSSVYRGMGLPEDYVDRTLKTSPRSMWYPTNEDLAARGLIAETLRTLDIAMPPADALLADYLDALRINPAWYQLEARYPGTINEAAERMRVARAGQQADGSADFAQTEALRVAAKLMPGLIVGSPPDLRRRYIQLLKVQLSADNFARCQVLLAGDLTQHRHQSVELLAAETAWLIDAVDAPPPRRQPTVPSAIELEVVRRSMRAPVHGLLAAVWSDTSMPASDANAANAANGRSRCEAVLKVLNQAATLPTAQRELVERVMFQPV